jgi:hypothetical protein
MKMKVKAPRLPAPMTDKDKTQIRDEGTGPVLAD